MKHKMNEAVKALRPTAIFTTTGNTYADIIWHEQTDNSITKPTESEVNAKAAELEALEPYRLLREERDEYLKSCDWVVIKAIETGVAVPNDWKTYRQTLRDLPENVNPKLDANGDLDYTSFTWPDNP